MADPTNGAKALVAGSTVYVLNARGFNRWSAHVQPGCTDDDQRVTDGECEAIAKRIAAALASQAPAQPAPGVLSDDYIRLIYSEETGFILDESPAALLDFARALLAAQPVRGSDGEAARPVPALTAQQIDELIKAYTDGADLKDGEYCAMVMFAAAVERAHGIGVPPAAPIPSPGQGGST